VDQSLECSSGASSFSRPVNETSPAILFNSNWRRLVSVGVENIGDCHEANLVTNLFEFSLNSIESPAWILIGELHPKINKGLRMRGRTGNTSVHDRRINFIDFSFVE